VLRFLPHSQTRRHQHRLRCLLLRENQYVISISCLLYAVLIHCDSLERKARNESKDIVHIRVIFGFYPFINAFIHDDGSLNILHPTTMTWLIGVIEPNLGVGGKTVVQLMTIE